MYVLLVIWTRPSSPFAADSVRLQENPPQYWGGRVRASSAWASLCLCGCEHLRPAAGGTEVRHEVWAGKEGEQGDARSEVSVLGRTTLCWLLLVVSGGGVKSVEAGWGHAHIAVGSIGRMARNKPCSSLKPIAHVPGARARNHVNMHGSRTPLSEFNSNYGIKLSR